MSIKQAFASSFGLKSFPRHKPSLSKYFPKGTQFYYGYPAGDDSGFINKVLPVVEELVAARAFSCAGEDISVLAFASTEPTPEDADVYRRLNVPMLNESQVIKFPANINTELLGTKRNEAIMAELLKTIKPGSFIMAQPYTEPELKSLYQIPPELSAWLNDKAHMSEYVAPQFLSERLGVYSSGAEFAKNYRQISLPVVIKASNSSSGDGVYICKSMKELRFAADSLRGISGNVLAERYVETIKNYALHFGVPHMANKPIDLIGVNEQIVSDDGAFMGGFIYSTEVPEELRKAADHLVKDVLPKVREMGWYGIGGFDVLLGEGGRTYFIDSNFRMTGMSAYHFMVDNGVAEPPLCGFGGEFIGKGSELMNCLLPFTDPKSKHKFINMVALSKNGDTWRFNAALSFKDHEDLKHKIDQLLSTGITSSTLEKLKETL